MQGIADGVMMEEPPLEEEAKEVPPITPKFAAQIQAIAVLRQVLYATDDASRRMLQDLRVLYASIRQKRALNARQTTMNTYFR